MSSLAVFSHPNHELAIFGFLQRWKPHLVYLTDGGGPERLDQTRRGLSAIGLLERAVFLNHREQRLYDALLDGDAAFYHDVARQVREVVTQHRPDTLLCDAVEFYNPVHDVSLPLSRAAANGLWPIEVFEVPLIHQRPTDSETYLVQRAPASRTGKRIELQLSPEELAAKIEARNRIYSSLAAQLGPVMNDLPDEHLALEVVVSAPAELPAPNTDVVLRYERRAALLKARGEIEREITYAGHYLPLAASLAAPVGHRSLFHGESRV